jgi:hypothetical protein
MKKIITGLLAIALVTAPIGVSTARADNLDQSNYSGSVSIGFGNGGSIKYSCQGFKPTYTHVTAVSFRLNSVGSAGMLVWIDAANSNSFPTGTLEQGLGSLEIPNSQLSTSLTKYTFATPISVTPNSQYVFCLAPWNTSTHSYTTGYRDLMSSVSNPYSNGRMSNYNSTTQLWNNNDSGNGDRIFEVYGENIVVPSWPVQSVDAMKYTKDVMCGQPTSTFIDSWLDRAVEIGATHVAIATPYQDVTCSGQTISAITFTMAWIDQIRDHNLKVWHRHPNLKFEGIYSQTKDRSPDGFRHIKNITDFIALDATYPDLIQPGDLFTPEAEPQNGGINGVTTCSQSICMFSSTADFNEWLRLAQLASELALKAQGIPVATTVGDPNGVLVGLDGFDGFITFGNNNPSHLGTSKIEAATVAAKHNIIGIDHYPSGGDTMAIDLEELRDVWPSADVFISEYGTIYSGLTDAQREQLIIDTFDAFVARSWVKGVGYWQFGPGGNEALINSDFTKRAHFDEVQGYYK